MTRPRMGMTVFAIGAGLMGFVTVLGKAWLQPAMQELGIRGYEATYGDPGMLVFLLFALGFPLGIGLCLTGGLLWSDATRTRVGGFLALAVAAALLAILVPLIFGTANSPVFFGAGGILIMVLVMLSVWYWGRYRAGLPEAARTAVDLQAGGYLWFAVAAWNLCGVGGMPSFALYPQTMLNFDSQFFAVAQMKVVMASFILGWVFTALGFRRARHSAGRD